MRLSVIQKLGSFCLIATFGVFGLTACSDDNTNNSASSEKVVSTDSSAKTAVTTDSTMKDTTATATRSTKRKRKASVAMLPAGTDKIARDNEGVYNRADVMPEYPGGPSSLSAYINDHIDYSQGSIDDNSKGTVTVSFVVDENGKVMNAHVVSDPKAGNGLDQQAVKVISNMPAWTPGKVNGKNVKTRLELPISFDFES